VTTVGSYWLSVTASNGCSNISGHQSIGVYPVPSVSVVVHGDTLASFNAVLYQWYRNGSLLPGSDNSIMVADQTGDYAVQITDSNGCVATSSSVYIIVTGVDDLSLKPGINLYPDPFTDVIFIEANNIGSVEVYDLLGRIVFRNVYETQENTKQVDLSNLPQGMYCVRITTATMDDVQSIVKLNK
jgi:hypothetical protein